MIVLSKLLSISRLLNHRSVFEGAYSTVPGGIDSAHCDRGLKLGKPNLADTPMSSGIMYSNVPHRAKLNY